MGLADKYSKYYARSKHLLAIEPYTAYYPFQVVAESYGIVGNGHTDPTKW